VIHSIFVFLEKADELIISYALTNTPADFLSVTLSTLPGPVDMIAQVRPPQTGGRQNQVMLLIWRYTEQRHWVPCGRGSGGTGFHR